MSAIFFLSGVSIKELRIEFLSVPWQHCFLFCCILLDQCSVKSPGVTISFFIHACAINSFYLVTSSLHAVLINTYIVLYEHGECSLSVHTCLIQHITWTKDNGVVLVPVVVPAAAHRCPCWHRLRSSKHRDSLPPPRQSAWRGVSCASEWLLGVQGSRPSRRKHHRPTREATEKSSRPSERHHSPSVGSPPKSPETRGVEPRPAVR